MTNKLLVFLTLLLFVSIPLPSFGAEYEYGTVEDAFNGRLGYEEANSVSYQDGFKEYERVIDPVRDDLEPAGEVSFILPSTTQYIGNMKIVVSATLQRWYSGTFRDTREHSKKVGAQTPFGDINNKNNYLK